MRGTTPSRRGRSPPTPRQPRSHRHFSSRTGTWAHPTVTVRACLSGLAVSPPASGRARSAAGGQLARQVSGGHGPLHGAGSSGPAPRVMVRSHHSQITVTWTPAASRTPALSWAASSQSGSVTAMGAPSSRSLLFQRLRPVIFRIARIASAFRSPESVSRTRNPGSSTCPPRPPSHSQVGSGRALFEHAHKSRLSPGPDHRHPRSRSRAASPDQGPPGALLPERHLRTGHRERALVDMHGMVCRRQPRSHSSSYARFSRCGAGDRHESPSPSDSQPRPPHHPLTRRTTGNAPPSSSITPWRARSCRTSRLSPPRRAPAPAPGRLACRGRTARRASPSGTAVGRERSGERRPRRRCRTGCPR